MDVPTLQDLSVRVLGQRILSGGPLLPPRGTRLGLGVSEKVFKACGAKRDGGGSRKEVDRALRHTFCDEAFPLGRLECHAWMRNKTVSRLIRTHGQSLVHIDLRSFHRLSRNNALFLHDLPSLKVLEAPGESFLPWDSISAPNLISLRLTNCFYKSPLLQKLAYFSRSLQRFLKVTAPTLVSLSLSGDVEVRNLGKIVESGRCLEFLSLQDVRVAGILREIQTLKSLRHLDISVVPEGKAATKDRFTQVELEELVESLPHLDHLDISGRTFVGTSSDTQGKKKRLSFLGAYKTTGGGGWKEIFLAERRTGSHVPSEVLLALEENEERTGGMLEDILSHLTTLPMLEVLTAEDVERCVTLLTQMLERLGLQSKGEEVTRKALRCITTMTSRHSSRSESFSRLVWRTRLLEVLMELLQTTDTVLLVAVLRQLDLYDLTGDLSAGGFERFSVSLLGVEVETVGRSLRCTELYSRLLNRLVAGALLPGATVSLEKAGIVKKCVELVRMVHFCQSREVEGVRRHVWGALGSFLSTGLGQDEFLRLNGLNWMVSFVTQTPKETLVEADESLQRIAKSIRSYLTNRHDEDTPEQKKALRCLKEIKRRLHL